MGWGLWCWEKLPAETPAAMAVEAEGVTQDSGPLRGPCEQGHSTIILWAQVIMRLRSTLAWAGAGQLGSLGLLKNEKHFFLLIISFHNQLKAIGRSPCQCLLLFSSN